MIGMGNRFLKETEKYVYRPLGYIHFDPLTPIAGDAKDGTSACEYLEIPPPISLHT